MTVTARRLVDGERVLLLDSDAGYRVSQLDVGFPAARVVTQPRPGRDGEDDTTGLHGASAVSMSVMLVPGAKTIVALRDALRSFCHPGARPFLVLDEDGTQRRIRLRADQQTAPIVSPTHQEMQLSWRAPDGVVESAAEQIGTAEATTAALGGRFYDRTYPMAYTSRPSEGGTYGTTYPATYPVDEVSVPVGSVTVRNDGNVPVLPLLRLYGPATEPRVENQLTGERLLFTGLTIAAGDWLEIDCRTSTIRLNGLESQSRYARLDFAASSFLRMLPGANTIRYYPVTFDAGARLEVRYRSAWL